MPEPASEGQQGDPVAPPTNPNPDPNPTPPTDPTPPPAGDPQDVEGYRRALEAARAEAKEAKREASSHRKAREEAEAKIKAEEDAKKSAEERAVARAEAAEQAVKDLQARMRQQSVRHAVAAAAAAQNFHKPADAYRFLDLDAVEFGDDGEPKGIDDLVKQLAKDHDYLVKSTEAPRGPQPTPRPSGNGYVDDEAARKAFATHTHARF